MSLKFTMKSRNYDPVLRSIIFYAMDGAKPVPCAITEEAVIDMGNGSKQLSSVKLLLLFDKYCPQLLEIAAKKYVAGRTAGDMVQIGLQDLVAVHLPSAPTAQPGNALGSGALQPRSELRPFR
ncbi:MAG: DUF1488 family protein [Inquilinus sp.]|uniref:DUF1488 family protein n=1 Tax=Inquilinus sp. TaxID=1932117 RepID=UPI003F2DF8DC